jgi:hypothetical protein
VVDIKQATNLAEIATIQCKGMVFVRIGPRPRFSIDELLRSQVQHSRFWSREEREEPRARAEIVLLSLNGNRGPAKERSLGKDAFSGSVNESLSS